MTKEVEKHHQAQGERHAGIRRVRVCSSAMDDVDYDDSQTLTPASMIMASNQGNQGRLIF